MSHRISQPRQNSSSRIGTAITLIAMRKNRKTGSFFDAGGVFPAGWPTIGLSKRMKWCHAGAIRSGATQMTKTAMPDQNAEQRSRWSAAQRSA